MSIAFAALLYLTVNALVIYGFSAYHALDVAWPFKPPNRWSSPFWVLAGYYYDQQRPGWRAYEDRRPLRQARRNLGPFRNADPVYRCGARVSRESPIDARREMNRPQFVAALAATAAAIIAGSATGAPAPVQPGLFPGIPDRVETWTLKAFEDPEGEVYIAFSAEAIVGEGSDYDGSGEWTAADFTELPPRTILSNDEGEVVDVDARLAEMQAAFEKKGWRRLDGTLIDPKTVGVIDQLWTFYN